MALARPLPQNCSWPTSGELNDNSVEDHLPQLLFRTTDGKLAKRYVNDIPEWAQVLL